jgi:DsbE subfamily thiol:disulfide oxidoreductase
MGMKAELRLDRQRKQRNTTFIIFAVFGLFFLLAAGLMFIFNANKASLQYISITPARVNYPAPELTLKNVKGNMESLANFKGKVVLVNNWATWCPPCRAEMPTLVDFFNDHATTGLMIVAIEAGEPQSEVQKFVDQYKVPFRVWLDPRGESSYAFNNNALPNSYVIDRTGIVRLSWTGEINRDMLEKYVTPLLDN